MDKRVSLPKGYELRISSQGSTVEVCIKDEIGRGGNCIVYKGDKSTFINGESVKSSVIVKEFYPVGINIDRSEPYMSLQIADQEQFDKLKEHFGEGQSNHLRFYDCYQDQALPRMFFYGESNNTVYAVSDPGKGRTLSQIPFDGLKLDRIASIMESICSAIGKIHVKEMLYLDCKPDNFFYYGKESDLQTKVYLFDFDTIVSIKDIHNGKNRFCSASLDWAPPEQELVSDTVVGIRRYRYPQNIGYHTDIYSIGAIFFWLLTQRKPTKEDLLKIQDGTFDWERESASCSGAETEVIETVQDILATSLQPDIKKRSKLFRHNIAIKEVVWKKYHTLYGLTAGGNAYFEPIHREIAEIKQSLDKLISNKSAATPILPATCSLPTSDNRFKYNSNSTKLRGRDDEIAFLTEMCQESQTFNWVGICGLGGSGKSRLAYELCSKMLNQDWYVFPPMRINEYTKRDLRNALDNPERDILICLDYIKQDRDDVATLAKYIVDNLHRFEHRIRLVLIEREENDIQMDDHEIDKKKYIGNINGKLVNGIIKLDLLSEDAIQNLISDYITKQDPNAVVSEDAMELILQTLHSVDREHRRPLYALFIADAWLNNDNEELRKWDRKDALNYIVGRELKRLSSIICNEKMRLNVIEQEKYTNVVLYLYALATYLGSICLSDYSELLEQSFNLSVDDAMLVRIMRDFSILNDETTIEGWVPDLLGEYYCIDFLNKICKNNSIEGVKAFVDLIIDRDLSAFVHYSDMIYKDFPDVVCDSEWVDVLRNIDFPTKYSFVRKNQFNGKSFLKTVSFNGRIVSIKAGAFRDCKNLERIILPSSLETIERYAFCGCENLTEALPEDGTGKVPSIITIESFAFQNCISLERIILPDSLQEMGISVFENCSSLVKVEIPRKVLKLDSSVFSGCKSLRSVDLSLTEKISLADSCFKGCEQLNAINGLRRITSIEREAFRGCKSLESIVLGKDLKLLSDNVFAECRSLRRADLSKCDIKSISDRLFFGCESLVSILLPNSIERIEDRSFFGCLNLETIELHEGIKSIGRYAFSGCRKLSFLKMPKSLKTIKSSAFENCSGLYRIVFGRMPWSIEDHAFIGCNALLFENINGLNKSGPVEFCGFTFSSFSVSDYNFVQAYMTKENVVIPNTVCEVGNEVFRGDKDETGLYRNLILKSVVFPKGLRRIGERAFFGCEKLQSIKFQSSSPIQIEAAAFSGCLELKRIDGDIPVHEICDSTFNDCCSLRYISFTNSLEKIGKRAFRNCLSLERVKFKANWIPHYIGMAAFEGCKNLKDPFGTDVIMKYKLKPRSFTLDGFVFNTLGSKELRFLEEYSSLEEMIVPESCIDFSEIEFRNINGLKKIVIPDSIKRLSPGIFQNCKSLEIVELPNTVKYIPEQAFANCRSLKCIVFRGNARNVIPENVCIGKAAFMGCKELEYISLPESMTTIEDYSFHGCRSLHTINIPSNIKSIGRFAFMHCVNLDNIRFPDSLLVIGKEAFEGCIKLSSVENFENTEVEILPNRVFASCYSLERIMLPKSVKEIKGRAFEKCHSLKIERNFLPSGLTILEDAAFQCCYSIESIRLPKNITEIRDCTFKRCSSLREVIFTSDKVEHIGQSAFYHCNSLVDEGITLPADLVSLGTCAFAYCSSLRSIRIPNGVNDLPSDLFTGCSALEEAVIPEHLSTISTNCFKDCTSLRIVNLHNNIKIINAGAFRNCTSMEKDVLALPTNLVDLCESAFRYCDGINRVSIPKGIKELSASVFEGCSRLTEVTFEHHIDKVSNYAFSDCSSLERFPFQFVDREIGVSAFQNCRSLSSPVFSESISMINSAAFRGCSNIESLCLPSSLGSVSEDTFQENSRLKKVVLPETVTSIKRSAFRDCPCLSDVSIQSSYIVIYSLAFKGCKRLDYIDIPANNSIEADAFEDCPVEVEIRSDARIHFETEENVQTQSLFTITEDETSDGIILKRYIGHSLSVVIVPEMIGNKKVIGIGKSCFEEAYGVEEIILPNSIQTIGINAFSFCKSLKAINIPSSICSIGDYAFKDCHNLISLDLSNRIETIGKGTFMYCWKLENIKLPSTLLRISETAFLSCPELTMDIPPSVQTIESGAFAKCDQEKIHISHMPYNPEWFE